MQRNVRRSGASTSFLHRLDGVALGVEHLKIDGGARGHLKAATAILLDIYLAEDVLDVPTAAVQRDRRLAETGLALAAVLPVAHAGDAVFERDDAELFRRAAGYAGQSRPLIDILDSIDPVVLPRADEAGAHGRRRAAHHGDGLPRALPLVERQQLALPGGRHVIDQAEDGTGRRAANTLRQNGQVALLILL